VSGAKAVNLGMAAFDLALGAAAPSSPRATLGLLGHEEPSPEAAWRFRRCGPIWLTFAAAHASAAARARAQDWWAPAWLRGTEIASDALWSRSPGFRCPLGRAGIANLAMAAAFARRASQS
jgi:hypothetical protein